MKKYIIIISSFICVLIISILFLMYFFIKPHIMLIGDELITLNVGDTYIDEGAKTLIGNKIVKNSYLTQGSVNPNFVGKYTLEYTTNIPYLFNKTSITRTIEVIDSDSPIITLKEGITTLYVGDTFTEPGYLASDAYDGNLTDKVTVSNNLDTTKSGTYNIEYKVSDSSGNETVVTRTITVKEKETTTTKTTNNTSSTSKGVAILMYHYFYDKEAGETGANSNYMEIHAFEEQMKYLSDNNYYFPTWQEIADYVDGKITLPSKSIVVTIDDGQYTFFNLAIPILNKYNITATAFIITSKAGGKKVAKYQYPNIIYQSHTHAMHTGGCTGGRGGLFRCIDHDEGVADLKQSIEIVGNSEAIAYPFGDVTDNVLSITKDAGFIVGVTIKSGKAKPGMDRYQLPRVRMYKGMTLASFKASI